MNHDPVALDDWQAVATAAAVGPPRRARLPTRADAASVAYRRRLKRKGMRFGCTTDAEGALWRA